ncbi:MAG: Trm112 family protein [Chloroflexi bacterium]|nr:Trm112 family protein [Chloroflexota bacterium]
MISQELLDILACPACKTPVKLEDDHLRCERCGRAYPIRDGIPVMLLEEPPTAEQAGSSAPGEAASPGPQTELPAPRTCCPVDARWLGVAVAIGGLVALASLLRRIVRRLVSV